MKKFRRRLYGTCESKTIINNDGRRNGRHPPAPSSSVPKGLQFRNWLCFRGRVYFHDDKTKTGGLARRKETETFTISIFSNPQTSNALHLAITISSSAQIILLPLKRQNAVKVIKY